MTKIKPSCKCVYQQNQQTRITNTACRNRRLLVKNYVKTEQHSAKIETIKLLISKSKIILDDLSKDVKLMKDEMYKTERTDD